jgi:hypothetical protein
MAIEKKVFTAKTYGAQLYKWSPIPSDKKVNRRNEKPFYCNALPNSQGQDWITTYVYNINVTPEGEQQRLAYVACDYVE